MRLCHRAGHVVPLLTITAVLAGCATSTTDQPANFNANPQVVAIYAVDSATGGVLPDVLIFSSDGADTGKISTNPPPSYGGIRVEFDQPINGATVANNADRGAAIGGAASFCSPLGVTPAAPNGNSPIKLIDVTGDGSRPAGAITASVCYDATSPLGQHPHVLIIPADNSVGAAAPSPAPLTCTTFAQDPGEQPGGNVFKPNHKYGVQVTPGVITNAANKPLAAPTAAGWVSDTFQFTTSGLKIMAAGFQDPNTGFFVWLDKPEPGFEKDLLPIGAAYQQPADASPFLIVFSEAVTTNGGDVTLRRDDGTDPASVTGAAGGLIGDNRVIEVNTGDTFEPGTTYKVTVPGTLASDVATSDVLGTAKTYTFTTPAGAPAVLSTTPANGAQAQAFGTKPQVEFNAPVLVDASGTPTGTFTLTGPGNVAVPLASVKADPGTNNQVVTLTPTGPLTPETTYQISASGAKVGPEPKSVAGQAFPAQQSQFTTATFRMSRISQTAGGGSIDRATTVQPAALKNGGLTVSFSSVPTASTVNTTTIVLSELNGPTNVATKLTGYTVTPVGTAGTQFSIAMPATYQPKYGQKYEVRAATAITDSVSGKPLKAEGCTTGDCSDVKSFTTRKVTATISAAPTAAAPTGFKVTFSDPIDPASLNPFLGTEFKLFERVNGALSTTPTPINCVITSATVVTCTAPAGLGTAPKQYLASAVFLQTATPGQGGPAVVDPAVSTDASARFFGSVTGNIFAACP